MKKLIIGIFGMAFLVVFIGCSQKPADPKPPVEAKPLVVFLARHAEKADASKDPELSEAGKERAALLAKSLRTADIEHIHSSDFIRTKDTAKPLATESGKEVEIYDPRDLKALAEKLKQQGGRHLVVGHSNTTPELAKLLGGNSGPEIDEKGEYDRLYIVSVGKDGSANSAILRYGKAFENEKEKAKAAGN